MLASGMAGNDTSRETQALRVYDAQMQRPVLVLSLVWLVLLVFEVIAPERRFFEVFGTAIWALFILDFLVRLSLAPQKLRYLRAHWLVLLSLALPALRLFQIARLFVATRVVGALPSVRFVSLVTSFNTSVRTLRGTLRRRAFAYVVMLTVLVTFAGAAGMFVLERPHLGFTSYGDALWFTAMIVLTLGSEDWPVTAEGRLLCVLLSVYSFTVLGYLTATLASMFIGADATSQPATGNATTGDAKGIPSDMADLTTELEALRLELQTLAQRLPKAD